MTTAALRSAAGRAEPGRGAILGALSACFLFRVVVALLAAAPLSIGVSGLVGAHPGSDAVLFQPGGVWLVEVAARLRPWLAGYAAGAATWLLLASFGWLLPQAALIACLAGERRLRAAWAAAGRSLGRLAFLRGAVWLAQALALSSCLVTARYLLAPWADTAVAFDLVRAGGLFVGLGAAWLLALASDAVCVAVVVEDRGLYHAGARAWYLLCARGVRGLGLAAACSVTSLAGFGLALAITAAEPTAGATPIVTTLAAILVHLLARGVWLRHLAWAAVPRAVLPGDVGQRRACRCRGSESN